MRRGFLLALGALLCAAQPVFSQEAQRGPVPMAAPSEPDAIALYADTGSAGTELWAQAGGKRIVRNVTRPTLTPVLPDPDKATGAAVVVVPGGGFMLLAIDNAGFEVARAFADRGIAAFVLKYRLHETPADWSQLQAHMDAQAAKETGGAMEGDLLGKSHAPEDLRAALALVRSRSTQWGVDPARVGVIGFSAGAMTARRVAIDADGAERPDFLGYIYGPQRAEEIPTDAPPLFNAIAFDDQVFSTDGFAIATAWHEAERPVEVHAYQRGGHAFGLGRPGTTTTLIMDEFTAWLDMQGFLTPGDEH